MGVGNDVNAHLLDQLAEVTDGSSEYFAPKEELDGKVAALYDRLSHPVLSGVTVSFGESGAKSVLPSKVPVLFKGSEIMMVGRYKEGGKHTFTIAGTLAGKPVKYTCEANLPKDAGEATSEFLAPLWAARQIGYLLQEIRLRGSNKELVEEVIRLSKQYGIVTEYDNINLIGQRAFYLQDGQWVDAEEAGKRKTRVVKILSPEYFELLKKDATFAKAQQLGWAISINVGAERIVVEKDGKQKDESLIPKAAAPEPGPGGPNQNRRFEQQIPRLQRPNGGPNQGPIPPLQQQIPPNRRQQDRDQ